MDRRKPESPLRKGYTTGACAAAAAKAAFRALLTGKFPDTVSLRLPRGETPVFDLETRQAGDGWAFAGVVKDAGDDPDVTHGAEICAEVRFAPAASGITFAAGDGVGTVTLPGLPLAVGEPAISPAPRRMIEAALVEVAEEAGAALDVVVTISVPGGAELAEHTLNGRLGIEGGLSILGTTGIVVPYSCASWIHSIHRGIDVARALGTGEVFAATGSTSERGLRDIYSPPDHAIIDMGDFAGGMLKYLRKHPIARLTIGGGFGKLAKLAQGNLDLHSARSRLDMDRLAATAREAGAGAALVQSIEQANTGLEALQACRKADVDLPGRIAAGARETALATLAGDTRVRVLVFDRQGQKVGFAGDRMGHD